MAFNTLFVLNISKKQGLHLFNGNFTRYVSILPNFHSTQTFSKTNNLNYFRNNILLNRNLHSSRKFNAKLRYEYENSHARSIMQSIPMYNNTLSSNKVHVENEIIELNEFEALLNKHWRTESASNIVSAFKKSLHFATTNQIALSDPRFNNLVDGLMDKCQDLTDDELLELLICVNNYPKTEEINSHNFHDIWSALDDICCGRILKWSVPKTLLFADQWYLLGLSKYCDYTIQTIKKLCRRVKNLTPSQLVQTLFYINVCRKQWSMFDFECRVESCVNELSLDELAVVSMSFFKTETTIKGSFLLSCMLGKLLEQTQTVHEITLSAILKIIRYSPHIPLVDQLEELLTRLVPEVDRLSILCCVHIALTGTNVQLFHPGILKKISQKFVDNISSTRLKDLERLTFALTQFNFNPDTTTNFFESVLAELRKPERQSEIEKYPRCLSSCVHYLGLQQIYPYDMINKVLDQNFIQNTYGNNKKNIGREILFIHTSLEIDCPDYSGNRLNNKLQKSLTKWSVNWIPRKNQTQRLTAADKLMLDIVNTIEIVHNKKDFVHIDYILPHFHKPDLIICKDKDGKPVDVKPHYEKYEMGNVMRPDTKDGRTWYAVVVGGWNMYIRNTVDPVGTLATKLRQLEKIGYIPVMVPWSEFMPLNQQQKEDYMRNKIM